MFTIIEDLAIEFWLEIFAYLNICHQFNAFFNLNKRLNQILFSYRYHITWKDNDDDAQYLLKYILPYITRRDDVASLRLENTNKTDLVKNVDLFHFPRLTTLILHRLCITTDLLSLFQQNTIHLRYLNISPLISGQKKRLHQLLEMIISLPNLQTCRLRLGISMSSIPLKISSKSPIKNLRLIGMNEVCFLDRLIILLQHLPYLKSLYIVADHLDFTASATGKHIGCTVPNFSLILSVNNFHVPFAQFSSFILDITSHIQELTILCRTSLEDLTYLDRRQWMMFMNALPNLKKITLDITRTNEIDEQEWNKKCQMLTKLMTRNHITLQIGKST